MSSQARGAPVWSTAHDSGHFGRTVAVKVFNQYADDADRVLAEARAQAGLSWHANIVSLYGQWAHR